LKGYVGSVRDFFFLKSLDFEGKTKVYNGNYNKFNYLSFYKLGISSREAISYAV